MRKLIYLIASTIDGFIAAPDGDTSHFGTEPDTLADIFAEYPETCPAHLRDLLGITESPRHFDTVIMGRSTHQPAIDAGLLDGAYPHLQQYVFSTQRELAVGPSITLVHDNPAALVRSLKSQTGKDIWLCGGGQLAAALLPQIDELHLKINPIVGGSGIPIFASSITPRELEFQSARSLAGGVQLITYRVGSTT